MIYCTRPQSCDSGFRGTTEDPFGGYECLNSPQTSDTRHNLGHQSFGFQGFPPVELGSHQNSVPDNDQKNFEEVYAFDIRQQYGPLYLEEDRDWGRETEIQPSHGQQIWDSIGVAFPARGVCDAIGYTDESDTAISGQSTPSVIGEFYPDVTVTMLQLPHGTSYYGVNPDIYQSTSGSLSGGNRSTGQDSSSSDNPKDTPPTQLPAGIDFNSNQDYPTTHSNHHPPPKRRRSQQRNRQDVKPAQRKSSLVTCAECGTSLKRPGDLKRHLETASVHSLPKGPLCPIKDCKYSKERFTRCDNFKSHLVKVHKVPEEEATRYIDRWKGGMP
ncbi:hypothetical protein HOY80DRAFT_1022683 [Tuber brumale]|nr:hypothetical protein HOY80DRAFT_1022683 [Tuber brumale]